MQSDNSGSVREIKRAARRSRWLARDLITRGSRALSRIQIESRGDHECAREGRRGSSRRWMIERAFRDPALKSNKNAPPPLTAAHRRTAAREGKSRMLERSRSDVTSKLVIIIVTAPGRSNSFVRVRLPSGNVRVLPLQRLCRFPSESFPIAREKRFSSAQVSNVSKKPERPCGARLERYENVR